MTFVSENVLVDTILSLGLMICFYYGLTAFAAAWYFREEALRAAGPAAQGRGAAARGPDARGRVPEARGRHEGPGLRQRGSIFGLGTVFVLGAGTLALGVVVMLLWQAHAPAFFRGETLKKDTPVLAVDEMTAAHPLDLLTADEIRRAVAVLRRDQGVGPRWRFGTIELREPAKGQEAPREALATCWNRDDGQTYKARVSLAEDRVVAWEHRPGEQANFTADEFHECDEALRAEPQVIAALERHGIHDLDRVLFDTWAYGGLLVPEKHRDRRVGWTDVWYRDEAGSPVREPHLRPALRRRHEHARIARGAGRVRGRPAADDGRVRPRSCPGSGSGTTSSRSRSRSPRAPRSLDGHRLAW